MYKFGLFMSNNVKLRQLWALFKVASVHIKKLYADMRETTGKSWKW